MTWLLHRVLLFPKHGEHFPSFKVLSFNLFTMVCSFLLLPMSSLRSLLRLIFVRIITLTIGKNRSYVIAKGMRVFIGVSFLLPFISSFLSSFSTALTCLSNSSELYPCLRNRCLSFFQLCSKSFGVVQIRLIFIEYRI